MPESDGYVYRNRNTRDEVAYPAPSARLERLDNWERISEPAPEEPETGFDPGEHTVEEVNAYLADATLDVRELVLQSEAEGKSRASILTGPYSDLSGKE